MKIYLALFAHIDLVARASLENLIELRKLSIRETGREYLVSERLFKKVKAIFKDFEKRAGGNAGNAAAFLNLLKLDHYLSAPVKSRQLLEVLGPHSYIFQQGPKRSINIKSSEPPVEHLVIEVPPNLVEGGARTIVSSDNMCRELWLDDEFWKHADHGLLFLSGFHLVDRKFRYRIGELMDILEAKPGLRIHLELGEPNSELRFALKKLLARGLVHSIGMNEHEAALISKAKEPSALFAAAKDFSSEHEIDLTIHSPRWVFSTNVSRLRTAIDIIEAYSLGDLGFYGTVIGMPLWRPPRGAAGTRRLPWMDRETGLGDAFAILDALRLHAPVVFEKATESLLRPTGRARARFSGIPLPPAGSRR